MKNSNAAFWDWIRKESDLQALLINSGPAALFLWDIQNPADNWCSDPFKKLAALSETTGNAPEQIISADDLKAILTNQDQSEKPFEYTLKLPTGRFTFRIYFFKDKNNHTFCLLAFESYATKVTLNEAERYKALIDASDLGTWEWNIITGEIRVNEKWAEIIGYTVAELLPADINIATRFKHPEDLENSKKALIDYLEGKKNYYECEIRLKHKSGQWVWVYDKGKVVSYTPDGKPEWLFGSHLEITDKKIAFEQNKLFIEQAPTAIAMVDKEMRYLAASDRWKKDYHIENRNIIGLSHYEVFPEIGEEWKKIHKECLQGAVKTNPAELFRRLDGSEQWLNWEVRPWYTRGTEIGGIVMFSQDITETILLKEENQTRNILIESILDSVDVGIMCCDKEGNLSLANRTIKNWHKHIPQINHIDEIPEKLNLYRSDSKHFLTQNENPLLKLLRGEVVQNLEIAIAASLDEPRIVSINGKQLIDEEGNLQGAVIAMHDITEQKAVEEKLSRSEQTFRSTFENAASGMGIVNSHYNWIQVNLSLCGMLGYTADELRSTTLENVIHPEDIAKEKELLNRINKGEINTYLQQSRMICNNGNILYVIHSVSTIRDQQGLPLWYISQITDITPQIAANRRKAIAISELEAILDGSTQVSIIGTNTKGLITTFNKGAENQLGYSRNEMININTPVKIHLEQEIRKREAELEQELGIKITGFDAFVEYAKRGNHDSREWTFIRKDGSKFPVLLTITAIRNNNEITGFLGIATDISQLKKTENELRSLLDITQEQNERLKNFAHIVSHNLRSHSGNISMMLELLTSEEPELSGNEMVSMLKTSAESLKETIQHLHEVVLINTSVTENLQPINLHDSIDSAINTINILAKEAKVEILNETDPDLFVLGLPAYVDSILLNFLTNGIKYRSPLRNSFIKLRTSLENEFVVLSIEDNGMGIDLKKHRRKLFGMYKTFHGNKDARGIGLFISRNQIEAIRGKIDVESEINQGTTFKLYLVNAKN